MLAEKLRGKKILFIGVKFYHYHSEIIKKMEEYGANPTFFAERDTSISFGIVNRLFHNQLDRYQELHYKRILRKTNSTKFDYLFVIRGYKMPVWFVNTIKERNPGIITIMYQWDANANSPFLNLPSKFDIVNEFDKVLSFDFKDVDENPGLLKYSPTFYTDEISRLKDIKEHNFKYDLFYFGSYLPERYAGLLKIKEYAETNGLTLKTHFHMPFRYYLMERFKGTKLNKSLLSSNTMNRKMYLQLFSESRVIVDVSNAKQTGIAMRVLDALGAGKKVLSTNRWITKEVGIDDSQVLIFELNSMNIPPKFFIEKPVKVHCDYSLDKWLHNIFD